ncbi:MAG: hypothetical protein RBU30_22545 [Polyangia bacterium]|jgi:hypothetical protein|nr:hypothetical protein [Polyangia bacterium]
MRHPRPSLLFPFALLAASAGSCRCEEPHAGADAGPDASDGALPDARLQDARPDARTDARTDAQVLPDATQHYFCDEPFFKLPIDGVNERTGGIAMQGGRVVWSKQKQPSDHLLGEVYLLDLETCVEHQLTVDTQAGWVHIHGNDVVWDDRKDDRQVWCSEIRHHDLATGIEERLTETSQCELEPKTNGRHVAYRRLETITDAPSLRLLDRQTGIDIELSPDWTNIESFDLNDRYVVWVAYTQDPLSVGRDVFYHDLATSETHHIDATYQRYQYWVFLWEDWVTIRGNDAHLSGPKHLALYSLVTNEERTIIEDDFSVGSGPIQDGKVLFSTSMYSGSTLLFPSDIEIYSLANDTYRRLTTSDGMIAPIAISPPYLLMIRFLGLPDRFQNDYYIANLETLGVLDASGMLLPGDPVIVPP